jgi:hypothetical protein
MPSGIGLVSFLAVWKEGTTAASNTVDALLLKILRDFSTLPAWFNTNGKNGVFQTKELHRGVHKIGLCFLHANSW